MNEIRAFIRGRRACFLSALRHLRGYNKKLQSITWKGLITRTNQTGTPILDFQLPEQREISIYCLSHPVYAVRAEDRWYDGVDGIKERIC